MPTKAELKKLGKPIKLRVRLGDKVVIIAGKDKGQVGFIAKVAPQENKIIVLQENPENADQPIPLNAVIKHFKAKAQGQRSARIRLPAPIHVSNVMVIDPKDGKTPTRIGRRREGDKIVRYAKKSGETIHDESQIEKKS